MSTSGDRHLRPEPSGKLKGLIDAPRTVLVRVDTAYAGSFAGQALLQLLINLLCRQFGVVDAVWLDIPHAPVDRRTFPYPLRDHDDLRDQLLALGRAVGGDEVDIRVANNRLSTSVTVLVGPGLEPRSESPFTLVTYGDAWDAFCSPIERSPRTDGASLVPFGPMLAACLAAGMVFRHCYHVASPHTSDSSLWSFGRGHWRGSTEETSLTGLSLPNAHLIGLGAVGAAFGLSLAMTPGIVGALIGIDPQSTDATGRNRLLSAFYNDIGQPKVALAERLFERTNIHFFRNEVRWPEYAAESERKSPPAVRREEDVFRYEWVMSCVDRNIHRQNIAQFLPKYVLAGSTEGLVAQATYYAMDGACECLACNHPIPTFSMDDLIAELQGLAPPDRLARYDAWGLAPAAQAAIDEYLYNPSCGHAAEADLRRLGVDGTTDWSVGFVSASAGIMLAAYFVRCAVSGVDLTVCEHPERRLIFLGAQELAASHARRKSECPICGNTATLARFVQRWART